MDPQGLLPELKDLLTALSYNNKDVSKLSAGSTSITTFIPVESTPLLSADPESQEPSGGEVLSIGDGAELSLVKEEDGYGVTSFSSPPSPGVLSRCRAVPYPSVSFADFVFSFVEIFAIPFGTNRLPAFPRDSTAKQQSDIDAIAAYVGSSTVSTLSPTSDSTSCRSAKGKHASIPVYPAAVTDDLPKDSHAVNRPVQLAVSTVSHGITPAPEASAITTLTCVDAASAPAFMNAPHLFSATPIGVAPDAQDCLTSASSARARLPTPLETPSPLSPKEPTTIIPTSHKRPSESTHSALPAKRRRASSPAKLSINAPSSATGSTLEKTSGLDIHPDFCYEDGSVIVTSGPRAFKLHKSRLEKASPYLSHIFKRPHAGKFDGLLVYDVSARWDDPDGLALVLREWEQPTILDQREAPPQEDLRTMYRASRALVFEDVINRSRRALEACWAAEWQRLSPQRLPGAYDTIRFAREMILPQLLPGAYYDICSANDEEFHRDISRFVTAAGLDQRTETLVDGIQRIWRARDRLRGYWMRFTGPTPAEYKSVCPHGSEKADEASANAKFKKWSVCLHKKRGDMPGLVEWFMCDPLRGMEAIKRDMSIRPRGSEQCASCNGAIDEGWKRRKTRVWEDFKDDLGYLLPGSSSSSSSASSSHLPPPPPSS
ncbi:hypothetical protein K488DRAFT_73335 [Vararia minispora EC-137]|uniref:Uncharacterized protein n=1 Tax=Vararia minispora EC-137 TaxID=1314806 RepID=A0ACB8QBL2_9AGAM|nr:hypothetical protein K488DRAFT_73335 [Vararia minispora EC-137]